MALEGTFGFYTIICDDPYHRGCQNEFGPYFGKNRIRRLAKEGGWEHSYTTNKYACNICMSRHFTESARRVSSGSMTVEEADNSYDPFTAVFVTMLLDGDTAITGDTTLDVAAGMMVGGHREEHPEEQPSAGYTAPVEPQGDQDREHPEVRTEAPEDAGNLPVVVDPFEAPAPAPVEDSAPSFTADLPVQEDSVAGSFSAAESPEPADSSDSFDSGSGGDDSSGSDSSDSGSSDSGSDTSY